MYGERLKLIGFKGVRMYGEKSLDRGGGVVIFPGLSLKRRKLFLFFSPECVAVVEACSRDRQMLWLSDPCSYIMIK